jgi:hypothetical protein
MEVAHTFTENTLDKVYQHSVSKIVFAECSDSHILLSMIKKL